MFWSTWTDPWRGRNAWADMRRLHREVNRLFEDTSSALHDEFPLVNIWRGTEDVVVTAQVPGFAPEDIDVSVLGDQLTIHAKHATDDVDDGAYVRRERPRGDFTRTVHLPYRVESNHVKADLEHGVLRVAMPRLAEDRPRKISIKAS